MGHPDLTTIQTLNLIPFRTLTFGFVVRLHCGRLGPKDLRNFGLHPSADALDFRTGGNTYNHRFGCWSIALFRYASDRDQHIGLGKISRNTTSRNRVGSDQESIRLPFVAFEVTGDVDRLPLDRSSGSHVLRIHKNHSSPVVDATIAIVQSIDRGVELIMAADRHQDVLTGINGKELNLID